MSCVCIKLSMQVETVLFNCFDANVLYWCVWFALCEEQKCIAPRFSQDYYWVATMVEAASPNKRLLQLTKSSAPIKLWVSSRATVFCCCLFDVMSSLLPQCWRGKCPLARAEKSSSRKECWRRFTRKVRVQKTKVKPKMLVVLKRPADWSICLLFCFDNLVFVLFIN